MIYDTPSVLYTSLRYRINLVLTSVSTRIKWNSCKTKDHRPKVFLPHGAMPEWIPAKSINSGVSSQLLGHFTVGRTLCQHPSQPSHQPPM